ncbi:MAG: sugar phosphate nucleotidyltransferase [Flavobacteriales bacterium]|nr:sugar phosphate nucleotidyltransferase [Flavobacteriales bacterium]
MKVIVPMAGMGKRLRPHTFTTPKPMLHVAGKPIVQRLVEDIVAVSEGRVEEIAYVVGRFGEEAEKGLISVAESLGAKASIHYQDQPLGTAHAIYCAHEALTGPVTVAFADTLFRADFRLDTTMDGVLWVQKIEDPSQFGVVVVNSDNVIIEFREKPKEFVSDLAMIGIYYFAEGEWLRRELKYLMENEIMNGGEYQLPDALRNMVKQGAKFAPGAVQDWMDCGNKDAVLDTNLKVLNYTQGKENYIAPSARIENSNIIGPCYIGENVVIENSSIGPHVSLGSGVSIIGGTIHDTIIMDGSVVESSEIYHSMIGKSAKVSGGNGMFNLGDFSAVNQK